MRLLSEVEAAHAYEIQARDLIREKHIVALGRIKTLEMSNRALQNTNRFLSDQLNVAHSENVVLRGIDKLPRRLIARMALRSRHR